MAYREPFKKLAILISLVIKAGPKIIRQKEVNEIERRHFIDADLFQEERD